MARTIVGMSVYGPECLVGLFANARWVKCSPGIGFNFEGICFSLTREKEHGLFLTQPSDTITSLLYRVKVWSSDPSNAVEVCGYQSRVLLATVLDRCRISIGGHICETKQTATHDTPHRIILECFDEGE